MKKVSAITFFLLILFSCNKDPEIITNNDPPYYNEISTGLNFGKIGFNLDYLEEQNHIGNENYVTTGGSLNFNDNNKLSFNTKKNFKTESTEFYDISYQYAIDCLKAGLVYRREFYEDSDLDVKPKDSLMFTITFVPFGGVKTPSVINQ